MAQFQTRDPVSPEFWSERFEQNFMPWDLGRVPLALQEFVARTPRPYSTLIPGCGNAYEAAYLAQAGWPVKAIDFSPVAVSAAKKVLGMWAGCVEQADFFAYRPQQEIDLIYERAFFCALPRHLRAAVVERWAELLPPSGLLAGYFFFGDAPKGPPFGIDASELDALLTPFFERIEDLPVSDSLPVFAGKERWQVWRRLA